MVIHIGGGKCSILGGPNIGGGQVIAFSKKLYRTNENFAVGLFGGGSFHCSLLWETVSWARAMPMLDLFFGELACIYVLSKFIIAYSIEKNKNILSVLTSRYIGMGFLATSIKKLIWIRAWKTSLCPKGYCSLCFGLELEIAPKYLFCQIIYI